MKETKNQLQIHNMSRCEHMYVWIALTAITGAHKVTTVKKLWLSAMKENSQWAMHS